MAIEVTDLSALDTESVSDVYDTLLQMVQEEFPDYDLKRGAISDLLIYPSAILATARQLEAENIQRSSSLYEINQDPTLADEDIVDRVLSNYQLVRKEAAQSTGEIAIVISSLTPQTIAQGAEFTTSGGLVFKAANTYNARISIETVVEDTDILITALGNNYIFVIEATAELEGVEYNIQQGAGLTPTDTITDLVTAYAYNSFTGGATEETNAELLTRQAEGRAIKAWSNRVTNKAMIRYEEDFENIVAISEVGYGDSEMLRYHSVLPVAFGGRSDVYIKSQSSTTILTLDKTATLISKLGSEGTWQFSITADDAPGFYRVRRVVRAADDPGLVAGYEPASDARGYDLTIDTSYVPDIDNALEANYSRHSTATITFVDTDTDASGLTVSVDTAEYVVYVEYIPLISELQSFAGGNDITNTFGDVLVKAAIPVIMSVSFTLTKSSADPTPDTDAVKQAVVSAVGATGFSRELSASRIIKAVQTVLEGTDTVVNDMDMIGRLYKPDGTVVLYSSGEKLLIDEDLDNMVSAKTVCFFLNIEDVAVSTETLDD